VHICHHRAGHSFHFAILEALMPWNEVMDKWKSGKLHSGSKSGPAVHSQSRAVAIMLSEKKAAGEGKEEYKASGLSGVRHK
jgi:hypothetical protein